MRAALRQTLLGRTPIQRAIAVLRSMFANGGQGIWLDPSDFSTMFQDSAGTTPVTALEQPVGLVLDKSKGLVRGPELVTNGGFDTDTAWTKGAGWTIAGGVATKTANASSTFLKQTILPGGVGASAGKIFDIQVTVSVSVGTVTLSPGGYETGVAIAASGAYTQRIVVQSASSDQYIYIIESASFAGTIDNISVREIPGNHASQATSTKRPVLSARVNLLTNTEDFSDAVWGASNGGVGVLPVRTSGYAEAPDGTMTALRLQLSLGAGTTTVDQSLFTQTATVTASRASWYIKTTDNTTKVIYMRGANAVSIDVTGVWTRYDFDAGTLAGTQFGLGLRGGQGTTNSSTADLLVWHPQLETGSTATRYQRVNTSSDYDTVGFMRYLKFDGVDDALSTASIDFTDFTATDKMTVVAGVRKLSDAVTCIVELSAASDANVGSFSRLTYSGQYVERLKGAVANYIEVDYNNGVAPVTHVTTSQFSLSASTGLTAAQLRINASTTSGSSVGTAAPPAGGNFGNYPLYIGARGGASLPFNGHLYSLIIRGAQSTDAQIAAAEAYVNSKTGAY